MNTKTISDAVIERLLVFMNKKDLTQYRLAQLSGIPFATIKSIMQRRTKNITLKTIIMLCDGLGITITEFFDSPSFNYENLNID